MKYSLALTLALAPLALAKSVRNSYPERRSAHAANSNSNSKDKSGDLASAESLAAKAGLTLGKATEVIIIWVNGGNNAATTTINSVQTVTQTVTAGGAAAAATTAAAAVGTTTGSAARATHTVTVGGPKGLIYEPSSIQAAVGDMVVFTFLSQNHTVTQSSFAAPCNLLAGGMDSGFQPNINNTINPPPQVALQVMVATPLWFYCAQVSHCGKGMVFSINPTANKTQAMFQSMAIAINGTNAGSAITGGTTTAAAAAAGTTTGAAAAAGTAATSATTDTAAAAATSASSSSGSSSSGSSSSGSSSGSTDSSTGVTTGTGTLNSDGSCSCAVLCSSNTFPVAAAQGVGSFGGYGGSIPMAALV